MVKSIEDMQKLGKDSVDATMNAYGAMSKGVQAIAAEWADYSKKAFEDGTAAVEKIMGAKSLDKAIEAQSYYLKGAYETFVSRTARLGELYADLSQEIYKPYETLTKAASAK